MKIVLLTLVLILVQSAIIDTQASESTVVPDDFQNLPIDDLDDLHDYLELQISLFYDYLSDYDLASVKQRKSPQTNRQQIIYLYKQVKKNQKDNTTKVVNESTVFVLGTENLTYFGYFNGTAINFSNYTQYLQGLKETPFIGGGGANLLGGFTPGDINNLNQDQNLSKNFILGKVAKLQNWTLTGLQKQVVAGMNYRFSFTDPITNTTEQYSVWSQPWTSFLQLTLPNGAIVTNTATQVSTADASTTTPPTTTPSTTTTNTTTPSTATTNTTSTTTTTPTTGGTSSENVDNLNEDQKKSKNFILEKVPKLQNWIVIRLDSQVVAGTKYYFTFKDPKADTTEKYSIWSQPWTNLLQLTLPDGTTITNTPTQVSAANPNTDSSSKSDKP